MERILFDEKGHFIPKFNEINGINECEEAIKSFGGKIEKGIIILEENIFSPI